MTPRGLQTETCGSWRNKKNDVGPRSEMSPALVDVMHVYCFNILTTHRKTQEEIELDTIQSNLQAIRRDLRKPQRPHSVLEDGYVMKSVNVIFSLPPPLLFSVCLFRI